MANSCAHVYVSGIVQGVAFRYSAIRQAKNLGVTGWVRNLSDGRVELWIEGEEGIVEQMVNWSRHGPRGAQVTDIEIEHRACTGQYDNFDVVF